jgi:hypothetical protein
MLQVNGVNLLYISVNLFFNSRINRSYQASKPHSMLGTWLDILDVEYGVSALFSSEAQH